MTKLTALAQLVDMYAKHEGVTSTKALADLTGYSERAIRKAKAELECRNYSSAGTRVPAPECRPEPECRHPGAAPRAHANTESPSEIVIPASKLASRTRADEIEGLNGSTAMYVGWLANWLNEFAPDHDAARKILKGNVELYGADKVRAGMLELETIIAGGEKPRNLAKAFPAFIKNANTAARPRSAADRADIATLNALTSKQPAPRLQPVAEEW